jgi:hypothetical protein
MASMKYVGLDVHKESIAVAFADEGPAEVRFHGTIAATTEHSASWSADSDRLRRVSKKAVSPLLEEPGAKRAPRSE